MAERPDGSPAGTQKVAFTKQSADRIAKVVRKVEAGDRSGHSWSVSPRLLSEPFRLRLGTFTGTWETAQYKTVTLYGSTQTASVYNWCNQASGRGSETADHGYVVFGTVAGRKSAIELPVAAVRLGKTTAAWPRNTSHNVQIWNRGDPLDEEISSPLLTVTAYNKGYDVAACVWVLIAQESNGRWYLVEAATPDPSSGGCAAPNIGGHDLTTVTGYASNKKQALTHDENACLKWVDIEECS